MNKLFAFWVIVVLAACSPKRQAFDGERPWMKAYIGPDPALAFDQLLRFLDQINAESSAMKDAEYPMAKMPTYLRLFALAHYLDKPDKARYYSLYTNAYFLKMRRDIATEIPYYGETDALFALEMLEYGWSVRWKTNVGVLSRFPPTESDVREYAKSIGNTSWLQSGRRVEDNSP